MSHVATVVPERCTVSQFVPMAAAVYCRGVVARVWVGVHYVWEKCWCCRGWTRSYNSLLNACGKWGRMGIAERVFESMQRHGPAPDIISYNTLLAGYAQVSSASTPSTLPSLNKPIVACPRTANSCLLQPRSPC